MISISLLFVARFVTLIGSPLVGLLVVRYLGPDTYGKYAAAVAVTSLFAFLCDFGVQQTVLRFGASEQYVGRVLKRGALASLLYTGLTIGLVFVWTLFFSYDPLVKQIIAIQCVGLLRTPFLTLVTAGLQLLGDYGRIAFWNLSTTLVQWLLTAVAIVAHWSVLPLVAVPILSSCLLTVLMVTIESKRLGIFRHPDLSPTAVEFFRESWKFGIAGTMYQVYQKADAAILSAARPSIEVGHYSVAMRMVDLANAIPGIVFNQVLYPKYFRWSQQQRDRLAVFYRLTTKMMLLLGANVAAAMVLFGRDLVRVLFQMDDESYSFVIPVLALAVMLHFWAAAPGAVLTTDGHVPRKIWIQGSTAFMSLLLNGLLIPLYGAPAAAGVFALSQLILGTLYTRELVRRAGFSVFDVKRKTVALFVFLTGTVMTTWRLTSLPWFLRGLVFLVVSAVSTLAVWSKWCTGLERSEIARLLALPRSKWRSKWRSSQA